MVRLRSETEYLPLTAKTYKMTLNFNVQAGENSFYDFRDSLETIKLNVQFTCSNDHVL